MHAKAIIPAPSLFKKFLIISGLKTPFAYFLTYIVEPIFDRIFDRWFDEEDKRYAGIVREACRRAGLDYYPVLLSEAETCSTCRNLVTMLVQPRVECWPCWRFHLQVRHHVILVAPGEAPQLLRR